MDEVDLLPDSASYTKWSRTVHLVTTPGWGEDNESYAQTHTARHVCILDMPAADSRRMSGIFDTSDRTLRDSVSPSGFDRGYGHHPRKASAFLSEQEFDSDYDLQQP